ncbi:MAG: hypothetical protein M1358_19850 [Chloroflexi bacterium]|nr:hypothetical protein [Chloroflexota bacterium]
MYTERRYWDPKIETMSLEELRILQERRLKRKVEFVYDNSAHFRRKFDEIGLLPGDVRNLEDINKIPLTNKNDLREGVVRAMSAGKKVFSEFLTVPERDIRTIHATSGTTGIPFTVPYTELEMTSRGFIATGDFLARAYWAAGLRYGDVLGHLWNLGGAMVGGGNHIIAKGACGPEYYMTLVPCHVGRTAQILKVLEDVGASGFTSTPSYALYIPEYAESIGIDVRDLKLKAIFCAGEPGPASIPGVRERLEEAWGAKVFDTYGAPSAVVPYECEFHTGFHIQADINVIQIIDPETKKELPPGEYGSIVGTTVYEYNEAFPWLRFDTEDRGALIEEPCPCGRTHPRIASVPGRWDDMVKIKGFQLHPNAVERVIGETKGCSGEFLIIVDKDDEGKDRVSIRIEHEPDLGNLERFRENLQHSIRTVITLKANVEMLPKGTLGRFVMKKQRIVDLRTKEARDKFEQSVRLRSAEYFD